MSEPFLAEVRMVGFNFAPRGWAFCDGQLLPINQNQSLFALLGTIYGGDGRTTFALPDLRGRVPVHVGNGLSQGARGGEESHALTVAEMPSHTHTVQARTANATSKEPAKLLPAHAEEETYAAANNLQNLHASMVGSAGSSQAHGNMQPYLAIRFCIALQGLFPSQT